MGVVLAVCIWVLFLVVYAAFNQPWALFGLLLAAVVLFVALRIAYLNKMIPTKRKPGEQANY